MCSGFGSIQRYDNMFGPSQWNAEDIDDFLVMQRDWGIDGGCVPHCRAARCRAACRAADAVRAVYLHRSGRLHDDAPLERVVDAAGSKDLRRHEPFTTLIAARTILESGLTMVDVIRALYECGFDVEAERTLAMPRRGTW